MAAHRLTADLQAEPWGEGPVPLPGELCAADRYTDTSTSMAVRADGRASAGMGPRHASPGAWGSAARNLPPARRAWPRRVSGPHSFGYPALPNVPITPHSSWLGRSASASRWMRANQLEPNRSTPPWWLSHSQGPYFSA